MELDIGRAFDSVIDGAKEVGETIQEKTSEFHENYVSKVLPDFGKYGEAAAFAAEMVPGVSEYNAIREGDWKSFAIAAGIDIAAAAIGGVTAGAGYAAVKGGSAAAKAGTKTAVKEIAEAGAKKAGKELVQAGAEKAGKELVEEGAEKAVKEIFETGVKEITEKGAKEVGEEIDKKLVPECLKEVEKITNREIKPNQLEKIQQALKEQTFVKLDPEKAKLHRKLFDGTRSKLIEEWQRNTGEKWPVYAQDVLNDAGEVIRKAGQPYDAHHLIESSFGGPNAWWNLHPAAFPSEHQNGIHAAGGLASKVF